MNNAKRKRPNFLIIVADDLGFSDTSPYGGEISTPNLQWLSDSGLRMTDFHTAPMCSPTRAMLLSGTDSHIAGLGAMWEQMRAYSEVYKGRKGYEGYLNFDVAALPEILSDEGYLTLMSGKWHLGLERKLAPCSRGFQKSFTFLGGAHNHYNNEPQLDADVPRVPSLCSEGLYMEDKEFLNRKVDLPADFYSTKNFTDKMIQYLTERDTERREQPFFALLTYTAPHWPLQAPKEAIEKYKGKYDDGPEALQTRRIKALQKLGLVPEDVVPAPLQGLGTRSWKELSKEEKQVSSRAMEIYSAMVDELDRHMGRVLDYLRSSGELDDTFILFMSDNGAEGYILEAIPMLAGASMGDVIHRHYNNEIDNLGNADSFCWYGPWWATAATAPSRGFKAWTTEGGIRCPCIIRYPPAVGRAAGSISHSFTTVVDIMPTILELAEIKHPAPHFQNRNVVSMRGKSWVQHLAGNQEDIYEAGSQPFCWELFGCRAVRKGNFKAVYQPPPSGTGEWELYDLAKDAGETRDLSGSEPEILSELIVHYETFYQETGQFDAGLAIEMASKQAQKARGNFRGVASLYYP